ncbi:MAG: RnfABCDGE type electron transport complex subunit D, partial [Oscillospiraceae bacterium]
LLMSGYLYGVRVAIIAGVSLVTALLCDLLVMMLTRRKADWSDISSYMLALIFVVMLPASVSYYIVAIGTAVTVLLGKQAFGGYGGYPFHPSAFGFAFTAVCFQNEVFKYPKPFSQIGLGIRSDAAVYDGISTALRMGGVPDVERTDLLIGRYHGPMGATFCLIILACLALLIAHGTMTWHIPVSFLATCSIFALAMPRIQTTRIDSLLFELLSGAVIFAAVYIVAAPSISPNRAGAKLLYGVAMGLATTLFRRIGYFEMGVCFATLLINPLAPWFDRVLERLQKKPRSKGGETE